MFVIINKKIIVHMGEKIFHLDFRFEKTSNKYFNISFYLISRDS